jgi:hypothetical protein
MPPTALPNPYLQQAVELSQLLLEESKRLPDLTSSGLSQSQAKLMQLFLKRGEALEAFRLSLAAVEGLSSADEATLHALQSLDAELAPFLYQSQTQLLKALRHTLKQQRTLKAYKSSPFEG